MTNMQMEHRHGGNGFAIVQELGDEYVRIVDCYGAKDIGGRVFLAWERFLKEQTVTKDGITLTVQIPTGIQPEIDALREALKSGNKSIVGTYIVSTQQPV